MKKQKQFRKVEQSFDDPIPNDKGYPSHWNKGALLNVRNYGSEYILTLFPEEYDDRYPERSLSFTNPGECQDFVSKWYQPESADPRARR